MKSILILALFGSALLASAQPIPVQQFNEQQQRRQLQEPLPSITTSTNAPELYPGENEDVGPQAILKKSARHTLFDVSLDSQYAWTDNNRLAENNKISTGFAINTVQAALAPSAYPLGGGQFAPRIGFRSQWYNYGLLDGRGEDALDFNAQTVFVNAQFQYHQKWVFDAEFDYTRLLDQKEYDEFYVEYTPGLSVQRYFPINDRLLFVASWQGMYHFTTVDPFPRSDVNDRLDNTLGLTLSYAPLEKLVLQPFYRFQYTYYPKTAFGTDRNDYFHIVGASVSYYFTKQIAARAFVTETLRESDDPSVSDYNKFDAGIGASLVFRF
jgi:hypothetical protein